MIAEDRDGNFKIFEELGLDRSHPRYIGNVLVAAPARRAEALENLFAVEIGGAVSAFELRDGLFLTGSDRLVVLTGGDDGVAPTVAAMKWHSPSSRRWTIFRLLQRPGIRHMRTSRRYNWR